MATAQITQLNLTPGMIDFGVGQPSPSLVGLDVMRRAAVDRLGLDDSSLLHYGAEQGDGYFRQALARFLSKGYGMQVEADYLFVTAGASQGLDFICTLFTQAGDTIFVEEPSYFLALDMFADHRLNVVGVPTDGEGLIIEALEEKLAEQQPALLYTIPTFHNPSSVTMSAARRERLVALSQRHNFLIVADEVYHLLNYTTTPPLPLASYVETGMVLSLGSFSKILAPGLRLGWIQTAPHFMPRFITSGLLNSGGGLNPFTSALVRSAIELGLQQEHLAHLQAVYTRRSAVLSAALRQHLPASVTFVEPQGGFFVWLEFPETVDVAALLPALDRQLVLFHPGIKFSSAGGLRNYARLSFAYYDDDDLVKGVRRLAEVVEAEMQA